VHELPGFAEGLVSVQSATAQRAAPLLLDGLGQQPLRVLDACAAPGGKTAHLLELAPHAQVTALELSAERSPRIEQNLQRLGLQAQVRVADAGDPAAWWDGVPFDAILLDAPCSASGIVRRHPDVRWLRRASDIAQLAAARTACCRPVAAAGAGRAPAVLHLLGVPRGGRRAHRGVCRTQHRRASAAGARPFVAHPAGRGRRAWRQWRAR
jgi:SAM-dependent methyltransferase